MASTANPWDAAASWDQSFVLVTGANSGVGLGIAQRTIDEFLASRSLTSHLILITTTRSKQKSQETTEALRKHLRHAANSNKSLKSRAGPSYDPASTEARVHLLSVQLDLCNLPSVHAAAEHLIQGSAADGLPKIPRLDAVIFNAGFGGWTGMDWLGLIVSFLTLGPVQTFTWPSFKMGDPGLLVDPLTGRATTVEKAASEGRTKDELLGYVFCSNVFGHYVLAHELLPLLGRNPDGADDGVPPGRIVWQSSVEPTSAHLTLSDLQGTRTEAPYESTKRLTDVLSLTANLPRVLPFSASFFGSGSGASSKDGGKSPAKKSAPRTYVVHPGVVVTTMFPLPHPWLIIGYYMVMYMCRLIGSAWHTVTIYASATAAVWVALQPQEALDSLGADRVKWGSSCSPLGATAVKKTEVEGWGWDGRVASEPGGADEGQRGLLSNAVGRKRGAVDLKPEAREEFEELGAECWREMERLRLEWEDRVRQGKGKKST